LTRRWGRPEGTTAKAWSEEKIHETSSLSLLCGFKICLHMTSSLRKCALCLTELRKVRSLFAHTIAQCTVRIPGLLVKSKCVESCENHLGVYISSHEILAQFKLILSDFQCQVIEIGTGIKEAIRISKANNPRKSLPGPSLSSSSSVGGW
jgi:hypothetical protein